jgi:lactate dehydrogenase-like 2-hydroxyacid dehydrogenase
MKPDIVVRGRYPSARLEALREEFEVHYFVKPGDLDPALPDLAPRVRVVVTAGTIGLSGAQMRALPHLELIIVRGAGTENVDHATARELGLKVTTGQGLNAFSVADHAMALTLSIIRDIPRADRAAREQDWNGFKMSRKAPPLLAGKRVGILGLGDIGMHYARRVAGFDVTIAYHNRKPRDDVPYAYKAGLLDLASESDVLMIAVPGGPATRHIVNKDVLAALGPSGYLINVGRGSVVDTDALVAALHDGTIAGAATDVLEGEPVVTDAVRAAPNLIITPHMAAMSPESEAVTHQRVLDNLRAFHAGQPLR